MAYSDFTLELVERQLGVTTREEKLFQTLPSLPIPDWLPALLERGTMLALISEKARSEFIVVPILLAAREGAGDQWAVFSGQRLDVAPEQGLVGECDFILALGPSLPPLHAPIMTILHSGVVASMLSPPKLGAGGPSCEAKKNDIEAGIGQCIAQMLAARRFNEAAGRTAAPIYGCVTNGETWQFLRLAETAAVLDRHRFYLDNLSGILGVFHAIYLDAVGQR